MILRAQRLNIIPLDEKQMQLLCKTEMQDIPKLERHLGMRYDGEDMHGELGELFARQIIKMRQEPDSWLYHTLWLIGGGDNIVYGSACFKNTPGETGEVEIGYGLSEPYRGHGYMTEAVRAMGEWALAQPGVSAVIAETEPGNTASERVLQRCGYTIYSQASNNWWRLQPDL